MSNTHVLPWLVNTNDVVCLMPLEFKTVDLSDNVDHYHCRSIDMMRCKPYDRRPTWIGNSLTISNLQASGSLRIALEYIHFDTTLHSQRIPRPRGMLRLDLGMKMVHYSMHLHNSTESARFQYTHQDHMISS
jgi:hypothetical protein